MFIHFFCLRPPSLTIKLNFNISKVAYYPLRVTLMSFELVTHSFKVRLRDRRLSYIDTQGFSARVGSASTASCDGNPNRAGLLDVCQITRGAMF